MERVESPYSRKRCLHPKTPKESDIIGLAEPRGVPFVARKAFTHTAALPPSEKVRYSSSVSARCQDAETERRRLKVT
ncbi:hypothetical protein F2P81_012282 [Scophthalmus maximus]|uniref:Uncharacterized protein n=1 Tax=Scophthalmus maximus TaxID=52904 RepID=A0A6A4SU02_SCOMX|nr:hypothetical protein F2P81_012282 [Scophthalmus maximus]